jgi:hypothetical protein
LTMLATRTPSFINWLGLQFSCLNTWWHRNLKHLLSWHHLTLSPYPYSHQYQIRCLICSPMWQRCHAMSSHVFFLVRRHTADGSWSAVLLV